MNGCKRALAEVMRMKNGYLGYDEKKISEREFYGRIG
jgi:hypothetical protein